MYAEYFKLSESPFSLTPDPRFLYMSERHREGLAHLMYGVQQPGGFVQLTGDIGSGKTTLCRCLIKQLPPDTDIALILNPRLTVIELLATVCDELGISYPEEAVSVKVLIDALNQRLLESHTQGRRTVLIIDEAQNLSEDVLEQIRLLTNLETSKEKLLQIILIGQPELLSILNRKNLRQLAQRITARYHLLALSRRETYAYIKHRLLVAGRREPLFTSGAIRCVYRLSRGMPRVINIICDRALLGAYAMDKQKIRAKIVRKASRETKGSISWRSRFRFSRTGGLLVLAALIVTATIFFAPQSLPVLREKTESLLRQIAGKPPSQTINAHSTAEENKSNTTAPESDTVKNSGAGSEDTPLLNPKEITADSDVQTGNIAAAMADFSPGKDKGPRNLADILAGAPANNKGNFSFANLYVQMGITLPPNPSDLGCENLRAQGYECLFQVGNWLKLRRYNLPAVLDIVLPNGTRRQVAITRLANEMATLAIGNWKNEFSLSEVSQVWDGSFILFWKPPFALRQISIGDSGKEVLWLKHALDSIEGKSQVPENTELFDEDLRKRVLGFQRSQSLIQDGIVGSETLVRLTVALQGAGAPSLSRRSSS